MNANPSIPAGVRIWRWASMALIAGVLLYFAFEILNTLALPNRTGSARVLGKAYYPPGTSYQTMTVGGRVFVRPYEDTAEAYVLKLLVNQQEAGAVVDKGLYDTVNSNSEVQVTYQRCRITDALRVVQVTLPATKGEN